MEQRFASVEVQTCPVDARADDFTSVVRVVANDSVVSTAIRAVLLAAGFAVEPVATLPLGLHTDPAHRTGGKNANDAGRHGASVDFEGGEVGPFRRLDRPTAVQVPADDRRDAMRRLAGLTIRQRQILDLVLMGQPSKNIAANLGISQRTVENHRAQIRRKTGCRSLPLLVQVVLTAAGRFPGRAHIDTRIEQLEAMPS